MDNLFTIFLCEQELTALLLSESQYQEVQRES